MIDYMDRDIFVLIIEDDLYSRNLMSMLLIRDWRTQVAGEATTVEEIEVAFKDLNKQPDLVLIDVEDMSDAERPFNLVDKAREIDPTIKILCIGTHAHEETLDRVLAKNFNGYLLKSEVCYALAWTVAIVMNGSWVMTPSVWRLGLRQGYQFPGKRVVVDGTKNFMSFTSRERDVAQLAVLFNLRRIDIADELFISEHQVNKLVSSIYKKLELLSILNGEVNPSVFFQDQEIVGRFRRAQYSGKSASEKATLAFHLLTIPSYE